MCTHDDGHYQCSFSGRNSPITFFKRPLSGDCRDLVNLNALQLVLTALCGETEN